MKVPGWRIYLLVLAVFVTANAVMRLQASQAWPSSAVTDPPIYSPDLKSTGTDLNSATLPFITIITALHKVQGTAFFTATASKICPGINASVTSPSPVFRAFFYCNSNLIFNYQSHNFW